MVKYLEARGEKLEICLVVYQVVSHLSPLTPHLCLFACARLLCSRSYSERADGDLLLILYLLAVNGLLFRADHVGALEGALLL